MEPWEGVISVPEGVSGSHRVEHFYRPPGKIARHTIRGALFGQRCLEPVEFDRKTRWHRLSYEGGTWMTDLPVEQQQHDDLLAEFSGRVLVGGLGLGYAATVLAARPEVEEVVVIEIIQDVIRLVGNSVEGSGKVEIHNADLFDYLKIERSRSDYRDEPRFDWAFYDIWQADGERILHGMVVPLRELSVGVVPDGNILCWNEDVMRGQLVNSLMMCSAMNMVGDWQMTPRALSVPMEGDPASTVHRNWACPFWEAVDEGRIAPHMLNEAARMYSLAYGRPGWRTVWGLILDRLGDEEEDPGEEAE